MRFLFTTLQFMESDFYGRVGAELARRGHEVAHVTFSRRAARALERHGGPVWCLPDAIGALAACRRRCRGGADRRQRTSIPTLRDVWKTDWPCDGRSDAECVERTVRHFLALERIFDEYRPEVVVPEVG